MRVLAVCLLVIGGAIANEFDEAFTIFIDLNDFHVTQEGNHEFLTSSSIAEHDNVVLHLSEEQVKYHQSLHDTHECEHPAEVHEVVSFLQEKMYEAPSASFIEDSNIWDQLKMNQGQQPFGSPFAFGGMGGMGMGNFPILKPSAPVATAAVAAPAPAAAPVAEAKFDAPAAPVKPTAPVKTEQEQEDEAISRFRDAYRAYKLLNKAVDGLGDFAPTGLSALEAKDKPTPSLFGSLIDDDDRKLMDMFSGGHRSAPVGLLGGLMRDFGNNKPARPDAWGAVQASKNDLDSEINKIVDDAVKGVFSSNPGPSSPFGNIASELFRPSDPPLLPLTANDNMESHHHHHHHHEERTENLSESEKATLLTLLSKLTAGDKSGKLQSSILEAIANPSTPEQSPVAVQSPATSLPAQQPVSNPGSRPSAPLMTSHIENIPKLSEFIPESVYAQQAVPFKEAVPELVKHVPKRILIPRMEEPGPVIGGSSRPVHIQIPAADIDMKSMSSTRPAAPSQMLVSSEITTEGQVDVSAKADVSVKASSVAAANDEALTQPEVVIFTVDAV